MTRTHSPPVEFLAHSHPFDVFDTLVTWRSGGPQSVLDRLEGRESLPGLSQQSQNADGLLGLQNQPYDLRGIWEQVGQSDSLGASTIPDLMDFKIRLEHQHVVLPLRASDRAIKAPKGADIARLFGVCLLEPH